MSQTSGPQAAMPALGANQQFRRSCGQVISSLAPTCPHCGAPTGNKAPDVSPRSRLAVLLLCWFFGIFGAHRFYVGKVGTGVVQLLTLGCLGIWTLVDFIMIIVGAFKDSRAGALFGRMIDIGVPSAASAPALCRRLSRRPAVRREFLVLGDSECPPCPFRQLVGIVIEPLGQVPIG
jgi:TM2 domain-containing membrane protein YozV